MLAGEEERGWYVHINVCGGIWACVTSRSLSFAVAQEQAAALRARADGKLVVVTPHNEKRGL